MRFPAVLALGVTVFCLFGCAKQLVATSGSTAAIPKNAKATLEAVTSESGPGAAVLIAQGKRVIYRDARGAADIQLDVPLTDRHVFNIASISKMFTAALVLKLVEDKQLALQDPLVRYLPDFPNAAGISIGQLLGHTAGISDQTQLADIQPGFSRRDVDLPTLVKEIAKRPPAFAPGTAQSYSNSGYILLGAVIEKVTGKPWHVAMQEQLLSPLGLQDTAYGIAASVISRRVAGYTRDRESGAVRNAPYISMTIPASAGALVSTVDDLHIWMRALSTGKVISKLAYQQMITPAAPAGFAASDAYGLGVYLWKVRGEQMIGHTGQINGFTSVLAYLPARDMTLVALSNSDNLDAQTFGRRLAAIALGEPYPAVLSVPISPADLQAISGSYQHGSVVRTFSARDGKLYARRGGGNEVALQMTANGNLHFLPDELSYFIPIRNAAGRVVRLDYYARGDGPPVALPRIETPEQ